MERICKLSEKKNLSVLDFLSEFGPLHSRGGPLRIAGWSVSPFDVAFIFLLFLCFNLPLPPPVLLTYQGPTCSLKYVSNRVHLLRLLVSFDILNCVKESRYEPHIV